jgi:hypothetical protein
MLPPRIPAATPSLLGHDASPPAFAPLTTAGHPTFEQRDAERAPDGRRTKPTARGPRREPRPPSGPPGNVGLAGSGASGGGGVSAGLWCVILLSLLPLPVRELRRHRFRLVLSRPVGLTVVQQRPG